MPAYDFRCHHRNLSLNLGAASNLTDFIVLLHLKMSWAKGRPQGSGAFCWHRSQLGHLASPTFICVEHPMVEVRQPTAWGDLT